MSAKTPYFDGMACEFICQVAGQSTGPEGTASVADGYLHCPDVTQEALDAAVAAYDHEAYLRESELKSKTDQINKEASDEILSVAPIYQQLNAAAEAITAIVDLLESTPFGQNIRSDPRIVAARAIKDKIKAVTDKAQEEKSKLRGK